MSMLSRHNTIETQKFYSGSPAKISKAPKNHITEQNFPLNNNSSLKSIKYGFMYFLAWIFTILIYSLCYIPGFSLLNHLISNGNYISLLFGVPLAAASFLLSYISSLVFLKKTIIKTIKPGIYSLMSFTNIKFWVMNKLLDNDEIHVMGDSLYLPVLLRFLGAKIGKKVESGELSNFIPELITIEDRGFMASRVAIPCYSVYQGKVRVQKTKLGKEAFAGNGSMLRPGTCLGDNSLVGCISITPYNNQASKKNTSWMGLPAQLFPNREKSIGYSDEEIFNPPKKVYLARLGIELIRILLPETFLLTYIIIMFNSIDFLLQHKSLLSVFLIFPLISCLALGVLLTVFIIMKWSLLGEIKPTIKPIWSSFIRKLDIITFLFTYGMEQLMLNIFIGTPYLAVILRLLGTKVGKKTCIYTTGFAEFDLIHIGDNTAINYSTTLDTHLYEDRIFKLSSIYIDKNCSIGISSFALPDTVMEPNSKLGSLSILLKGETLPQNTAWEGSPAEHIYTYQSIKINNNDAVELTTNNILSKPC